MWTPDSSEDALTSVLSVPSVNASHVLFALFTVMLVLATIGLVAHDIEAYEMHARDARLDARRRDARPLSYLVLFEGCSLALCLLCPLAPPHLPTAIAIENQDPYSLEIIQAVRGAIYGHELKRGNPPTGFPLAARCAIRSVPLLPDISYQTCSSVSLSHH